MIKTTSYSKQDSKLQKDKFLNIVFEQAIQMLKVLILCKAEAFWTYFGPYIFLVKSG